VFVSRLMARTVQTMRSMMIESSVTDNQDDRNKVAQIATFSVDSAQG
jgi:hypothetical protein